MVHELYITFDQVMLYIAFSFNLHYKRTFGKKKNIGNLN